MISRKNEVILNIDKGKIVQVISNLITNAIKYSAEKSTVVVKSFESSDHLDFSVKDQNFLLDCQKWFRIFRSL